MGADDNLSAIAVLIALAQFLNKNRLNNTEVWLVSHGCEEIGDRGSKRFSKKHYDDLKNALVINLDMLGGKNSYLKFVTSEEMGIVRLSKVLALKLSKLANELNIPNQIGRVEAFTDSMSYSQSKIRACSIVSLSKSGLPTHYHTTNDTIDKMEFQNLWDCYRILTLFLKRVDGNKLSFTR